MELATLAWSSFIYTWCLWPHFTVLHRLRSLANDRISWSCSNFNLFDMLAFSAVDFLVPNPLLEFRVSKFLPFSMNFGHHHSLDNRLRCLMERYIYTIRNCVNLQLISPYRLFSHSLMIEISLSKTYWPVPETSGCSCHLFTDLSPLSAFFGCDKGKVFTLQMLFVPR